MDTVPKPGTSRMPLMAVSSWRRLLPSRILARRNETLDVAQSRLGKMAHSLGSQIAGSNL